MTTPPAHRLRTPLVPVSTERFVSLDGLRGVAALVVVVHHCLLISPALAATYRTGGPTTGWTWWLTYTPAHLVWAGGEAVTVFFVLSGFVLALPFVRPDPPGWQAYYPQRLVRLYLPVAAAVAFALALFVAVDHTARPGLSWWLAAHQIHVSPGLVVRDLVLVAGTSAMDSPLWSLRWEVLFSLALPIYVLAARRTNGWWRAALGVALVGAVACGAHLGSAGLTHLPMFGVGVLLAAEQGRLRRHAERLPTAAWVLIVSAAIVLLLARWWPIGVAGSQALATVGATAVVATVLGWPKAAALTSSGVPRWLGKVSFSLYLIHEPIAVTVAFLLRATNPVPVLAITLPVTLAFAAMFFHLVEAPAHRVAKRVGRSAGATRVRVPGQLLSVSPTRWNSLRSE